MCKTKYAILYIPRINIWKAFQWEEYCFCPLQIPLNLITHGLAFHQEISRDPDLPYNDADCFNKIRDAVSERAIVLSNAAEDNGASAVSL